MKFTSIVALALAAKTTSVVADDMPCRAKCTGKAVINCYFEVSRDPFASELGYFKFSGADGDCGGTNPTLGIEKGKNYYFIQKDVSNYYHPLGFAYEPDGALKGNNELEPGISGPACCTDDETDCADDIICNEDISCEDDNSCPAPMYRINGEFPGKYTNNPSFDIPNTGSDNFGLDDYEPEFFYPVVDWLGSEYEVVLLVPEDYMYTGDFFYFCHIHNFMSGRIKFINADGTPITEGDSPALGYEYQVPSEYDATCGTYGLDDFQLPNTQCPEKFVCNAPDVDTPAGKFAECIDSMNCAMLTGMTSNVNQDSALGLFIHQMIPHHQNAVNMCKALLISGEIDCDDLTDEDSSLCGLNAICQEIINVQNAQIQAMYGFLDAEGLDRTDDCEIQIDGSGEGREPTKTTKSAKKNGKGAKRERR